jgi:hypothetical protein
VETAVVVALISSLSSLAVALWTRWDQRDRVEQLRRCDRWRARQLKPFPRASRSSTDRDQIARIAEGIREGPNALQPAVEKVSADAYLASPYVTDTMGETR